MPKVSPTSSLPNETNITRVKNDHVLIAWCLRGKRKHRAYRNPGRVVGEIWWCPRHGIIFAITLRGGIVEAKRMPRRFR